MLVMRGSPKLAFLALCACVCLLIPSLALGAERDPARSRYVGSSLLAMPTGYTQTSAGFINDDSHSMGFYSQQLLGRFLEMSALYHLDGRTKGRSVLNLKVNFLAEGVFMPSLACGVGDYKEELGSKIFYVAGSKTLDVFGARIHGGFVKDPVTTEKIAFYGIEKTIFPLVAVMGERYDDENTFGLRLNPYPGISVEYARRMISGGTKQQSQYRVIYNKSF